jgi:hypothetical protein
VTTTTLPSPFSFLLQHDQEGSKKSDGSIVIVAFLFLFCCGTEGNNCHRLFFFLVAT